MVDKYAGSLAGGGAQHRGVDAADAARDVSLHETLVGAGDPPVLLRAVLHKRHGGLHLQEDSRPDHAARAAVVASQMRSMLTDRARCDKFDRAIRARVAAAVASASSAAAATDPSPETAPARAPRVLDIGAGTGLLAMCAARAGAAHVDAVEMFAPMADLAKRIVADNGLADTVDVYGGYASTDMSVEDADRYDVLVTEIFDTALLGEGVLPVLQHAREKLVKPGAITVPASATVYGRLVESPSLFATWHDLSSETFPFHRSAAAHKCAGGSRIVPVHINSLPDADVVALSAPFEVFSFDFSAGDGAHLDEPRHHVLQVPLVRTGVPHAVVLWWELDLVGDGSIVYSTAPGREPWQDHWLQGCFPLPASAREYHHGDSLLLSAGHTRMDMWFSLDPNARSPRPCSCGYHALRGGPARISALGSLYRTDSFRRRINKCIIALVHGRRDASARANKSAASVRVLDISTGSSICGLLAAEAGTPQCAVHVTSLETEHDEDSLDCLLYEQVAAAWLREGKIESSRPLMDGNGTSEEASSVGSSFHMVHHFEELEDSVDSSGELFDVLVAEPWHPAMQAWPSAAASSLWLRRSALATLFAPDLHCVPSRCVLKCQLLEFKDETLAGSFGRCGRVVGFDHAAFDDLCVAERKDRSAEHVGSNQMPDAYEHDVLSLPLYMYPHRALSDVCEAYGFNISDMPPAVLDARIVEMVVSDSGRLDAVAVWAEYDGVRPARMDAAEVLLLGSSSSVSKDVSVRLECRWDRHGIGGFGFRVAPSRS